TRKIRIDLRKTTKYSSERLCISFCVIGYNSVSEKEDHSVGHNSAGGGDSWESSGDEDANMFASKSKSTAGKPSLLAALNKSPKPVTRAGSDASTQSAKSSSRIPVKTVAANPEVHSRTQALCF
ncbi:uncharacterized protein LOC122963585, partial [Acropora millepora]|uniref:uncharacterized protein LOC122963585 n=1 Tax=Acropora millepora TaxID=45264 RepID=UPI001CF59A49